MIADVPIPFLTPYIYKCARRHKLPPAVHTPLGGGVASRVPLHARDSNTPLETPHAPHAPHALGGGESALVPSPAPLPPLPRASPAPSAEAVGAWVREIATARGEPSS